MRPGEAQNAAAKAMGFDIIPRSVFVSAETGEPLYPECSQPPATNVQESGLTQDEWTFEQWWSDRDKAFYSSIPWKVANMKLRHQLTQDHDRLRKLAYVSWMSASQLLRAEFKGLVEMYNECGEEKVEVEVELEEEAGI